MLSYLRSSEVNVEFIGAIANERPSDVFHTGWGLNPTVNTLASVRLIVSVEPIANIAELV